MEEIPKNPSGKVRSLVRNLGGVAAPDSKCPRADSAPTASDARVVLDRLSYQAFSEAIEGL